MVWQNISIIFMIEKLKDLKLIPLKGVSPFDISRHIYQKDGILLTTIGIIKNKAAISLISNVHCITVAAFFIAYYCPT